jgi:hypothetical protein
MSVIDLGDEDGFVSVKFCGVEKTLDLWLVNDRIAKAVAGKEGDAGKQAVAEVMQQLGFPTPSHRVAVLFANAIIDAVDAVKKKPDASAPSPASTASTPEA